MANKPYPTPANLSEQLVNLGWRLATEMRALYNTVKTKISKTDADAAYLGKTAKAASAKTADVATKATQDGNGKVIASTYALKTSVPTAMKGATSTAAGSAGTVPAPAAGAQAKFLRGDGTWQTALTSQTQADWNATSGVAAIKNKPTIPSKTSQLTNDSNFATTGAIPTKVSQLTNDSGYLTTQVRADWNATEGYGVINNKPTIPTKVSDLTNDSGFLTTQQQVDWNATSGVTAIKNKPTIPTKTSQLQNDSGFSTSGGIAPTGNRGSLAGYETPAVMRDDGDMNVAVSPDTPDYTYIMNSSTPAEKTMISIAVTAAGEGKAYTKVLAFNTSESMNPYIEFTGATINWANGGSAPTSSNINAIVFTSVGSKVIATILE